MHTQTTDNHRERLSLSDLNRWAGLDENGALATRLLSEQVAIPLDQLARYLQLPLEQAIGVVQQLSTAGYLEHRRFLIRDWPWYWLSRLGLTRAGSGFFYLAPDVSSLAHRRAVNEVRLHLSERAPEGRWVCERIVSRRRDPNDHLPDAVFEIAGERHAIEAELSLKPKRDIRHIVAQHSDRYDAVLYFCGRRTYGPMKRLSAEGRWPKLVVRRMPEGP
jgi:hypothetical protein